MLLFLGFNTSAHYATIIGKKLVENLSAYLMCLSAGKKWLHSPHFSGDITNIWAFLATHTQNDRINL